MPLYTKALPAADLAFRLRGLAGEVWPQHQVQFRIGTNINGLKANIDASGTELANNDTFERLIGKHRQVVAESGSVKRPGDRGGEFRYAARGDLVSAELHIEGAKTADEAVEWLNAVAKHFELSTYIDLVSPVGLTEPQRNALQAQERSLADFKGEIERLADFLSKIAREDAEQRRKLQIELEQDYRAKADAAAAEHQRKLGELEGRRRQNDDDFAARMKAFEAEKAAFETSEAKHVRRRMLAKLEEVLAKSESMSLSDSTQRKRWPVHVVVGLALLTSGMFVWSMAARFLSESEPDWHFGLPMATGTLTFVAMLIYYVRWNDRWFREHAEGELAAKRYQADIVRANWLAELVAEQRQLEAELPSELLEAFTRNLFRGTTTLAEAEHPFEQVTAMLKRAKELKVGGGQLMLRAGKAKPGAKREDG
jgi:hypothetical protein